MVKAQSNFYQKILKITEGLATVVNLFADALKAFANVLDLIPAPVLEAIGGALGALAVSVGAFMFYASVGNTLTRIGVGLKNLVAAATAHPLLTIAAGLTTLAWQLLDLQVQSTKKISTDHSAKT